MFGIFTIAGIGNFIDFLRKIAENVFLIKPQMGTRIHRNTSSEPLTTFLRRTMRSRQDVLFNFGSFLPKFGCHCNSLEILGSIFEIADTENPTIHAKFVSISYTEMKLCLFECFAYLYHCMYTLNHKKRDILFLTITLANLT